MKFNNTITYFTNSFHKKVPPSNAIYFFICWPYTLFYFVVSVNKHYLRNRKSISVLRNICIAYYIHVAVGKYQQYVRWNKHVLATSWWTLSRRFTPSPPPQWPAHADVWLLSRIVTLQPWRLFRYQVNKYLSNWCL